MANTFENIAKIDLTTDTSTIDFTSIPQTYTDLCLKLSLRLTTNSVDAYLTLNNASGAHYNYSYYRWNVAVGSATATVANQTQDNNFMYAVASTWTANAFGVATFYFNQYAKTDQLKPYGGDSFTPQNSTDQWAQWHSGYYQQNTAISRITITNPSGSFAAYSTAYLYGIKKN